MNYLLFPLLSLQWILTGPRVIHSADGKFDATYQPNVTVHSSGDCLYITPSKSHGPTCTPAGFTIYIWSLKPEQRGSISVIIWSKSLNWLDPFGKPFGNEEVCLCLGFLQLPLESEFHHDARVWLSSVLGMTGMDRETRVPRSADCPWSMGDHQLPFSGPWTWRRQAYPFQFLHVLMFLLTLMAVPSGFFRAWEGIFLLDGAQLGAFAHMSHVPLTDFTRVHWQS